MSKNGLSQGISDSRFRIQFDVEEPVDLLEIAGAFGGLSRLYLKNLKQSFGYKDKDLDQKEVKLYITDIKSNCILAELGSYAALGFTAINALDYHNILKEFCSNLNIYFNYFLGKSEGILGKSPSIQDCKDFKDILEPVAKKKGGNINLEVMKTKDVSSLVYNYSEGQTTKAYENVEKHIDELELVSSADHQKVLMYLPQLNAEKHISGGRSTPDRGIIESISNKDLPVYWLSEMDSQKVKNQQFNPHKAEYIVDVNVQTKQGLPKMYRVLRLHDIIQE